MKCKIHVKTYLAKMTHTSVLITCFDTRSKDVQSHSLLNEIILLLILSACANKYLACDFSEETRHHCVNYVTELCCHHCVDRVMLSLLC